MRILTERMPHVRSVAVGVWVETGSRHEVESRGGVSHLIEHLVFKGTATRSAEAIARTMDSVGGQMDAFTTKENTCFYVQVLDQHLPLAVDLLTDILLHPLFDAEELEREVGRAAGDPMVEDTPDDIIHDLFAAQIWVAIRWPGHPRHAGAGERIHRTPSPTTSARNTCRRGSSSRWPVTSLTSKSWSCLARASTVTRPARPQASEAVKLAPGINIVHKALEQVHLVMGFPGLAHAAPERYAMFVLNDVIGGSMSSRLFQEVRERQGLAYSVHSGAGAPLQPARKRAAATIATLFVPMSPTSVL
jgi:predicted Zn-dependent peptidase